MMKLQGNEGLDLCVSEGVRYDLKDIWFILEECFGFPLDRIINIAKTSFKRPCAKWHGHTRVSGYERSPGECDLVPW